MNPLIIEEEDWPLLRDVFKFQYPEHIVAYSAIAHYINIKDKHKNYYVRILSIDNEWRDHGTFITFDGFQCQVYTLDKTRQKLFQLLNCLPMFMGFRFCSYPDILLPVIKEVSESRGFEFKYSTTTLFWLPKNESENFVVDIPENTYLEKLKVSDATQINSVWPNRYKLHKYPEYGPHYGKQDGSAVTAPKSSEDWICDMIMFGDSIGLYDTKTNQLMSWVMILHNDGLCALQTEEQHWRKGYGRTVLKAIAKLLASKGKDTFAFVSVGNINSENLFKSLGFKEIGFNLWTDIPPYDKSKDGSLLSNLKFLSQRTTM